MMAASMNRSSSDPPPPILVEDTETGEGPLPSLSPEGMNREYYSEKLGARASRKAYQEKL
jgi:hypothetical protein